MEQADYNRLKAKARPLWLRALLATAYAFGFRESELLTLRVKQADLLNRSIRLNAGETKSGDGRVVKLTEDVGILRNCTDCSCLGLAASRQGPHSHL